MNSKKRHSFNKRNGRSVGKAKYLKNPTKECGAVSINCAEFIINVHYLLISFWILRFLKYHPHWIA
jgi:hypothetical protein